MTKTECSNPDCDLGWVFGKYLSTKVVRDRQGNETEIESEYEGVTPCPICDPTRAQIFTSAKSRDELQEALANRSTHKRLEAYRQSEDSKTRVL
jgi:hypothetical protein